MNRFLGQLRSKERLISFLAICLIMIVVSSSKSTLLIKASKAPIKPVVTTSKIIIDENALPGTTDWQILPGNEATIQIQAYASAASVSPGLSLTFYVSTQKSGTLYSIAIYRLGWYGGKGARLMKTVTNLHGRAQGYYNEARHQLVNCFSCMVNRQTGLVEANWLPSYMLKIPSAWVTGVYLAKFDDASGYQTYVPFDILGNFHSVYVAVTPDTTNQAYNEWGGYSLYPFNSLNTNGLGRGVKVSFDRPYTSVEGTGGVLFYETDAIRWFERQGYDISYISNLDLDHDPRQLLSHDVYISLGHDEYWTKAMRDGVQYARDQGVSLAFLGANASYWQMRFEPDSKGIPDRTIVCYKVETSLSNLNLDPLYGKDNSRVTAQWRDSVIGRPENALIGIMFSDLIQRQRGYPWQVAASAVDSPLLQGTGLRTGVLYGCDLVGYEWDRLFANGATPGGLQVLGLSYTIDDFYKSDTSNTTYYFASSGAMVFATGSTFWTNALDDYRFSSDPLCAGQDTSVPGIQKLMANIMRALANKHL